MLVDQEVSIIISRKELRIGQDFLMELDISRYTDNCIFAKRALHLLYGLLSCIAVCYDLCNHRVVIGCDFISFPKSRI